MTLEVQIQSLIYSFVYGLSFSFFFNLHYRYLYLGKIYYRIVTSIFFVLVNVFLYFLLLRLINCGVIHPYFLLMILLGFFVGNSKTRVVRFLFRKKKKS